MKKILCLIILVSTLTGCTSTIKGISSPIDKPALNLDSPPPMKLAKVEFVVIHKDNAEKIFAEMEAKGLEPVLFGLSGTDYKHLSVNMAEIKTFIKLQNKIIILYKDYYEKK